MIKTFPVVVLGMHRSGTSMLSHCLIKLGVDMGSDLLEPDEGNPLGYFEDREFLELNKAIIRKTGGEWNFPTNRKKLHQIQKKFRQQMSELVIDRATNHRNEHWGWKDPRNSLTAWMWHKHIVTYEPKYIIIHRNRPDILKSLLKRNADAVNWAQLAKNYSDNIAFFVRNDLPKVHVCHYEDFVKSKEKAFQELSAIAKFLNLKVPNKTVWKAVGVVKVEE